MSMGQGSSLVRSYRNQSQQWGSTQGRQKLLSLERGANENPYDTARQVAYLKELNQQGMFSHTISRFQNSTPAVDDGVLQQYIFALSRAGRLDQLDVNSWLPRYAGSVPQFIESMPRELSYERSTLANAYQGQTGGFQAQGGAGTQSNPLHVSVLEPPATFSQKARSWVTPILFGVMTVAFIMFMMDKSSPMKSLTKQPAAVTSSDVSTRFHDVMGVDEAKNELEEVVEFLRNPDKFTRLGGKLPKGVLLLGPPGSGKTLLAKAVAGEAGVPFLYASGSEFEEVYVGLGAKRVRELFAAAKKKSPCLIFIDEIDAIGGTRSAKDHQYHRMTLNQLLVELDGFNEATNVIVIGATNLPEVLDKALTRPGRFDKHVTVPLPDVRGRKQIIDLYLEDKPISEEIDSTILARGTTGFSGADLYNLVNVAAVRAAQIGLDKITMKELEAAKDKILMGAERKSAVLSEENRKITAYHEGGHALVAIHTSGALPIHKATIMPRGQALGMVSQLPDSDQVHWTKRQLLARLDVAMGGRVAEEMIFGEEDVTTGALSDFNQANQIARSMVLQYGMCDRVGPMISAQQDDLSPSMRQIVDEEVQKILQTSYQRSKALLESKEGELHTLAEALLKYETLNKTEIESILRGEEINRLC